MTGPAMFASFRISSNAPSYCRRAPNFVLRWRTSIGRNRSHSSQPETLAEVEYGHILKALKESGWVVGGPMGAARKLGLKRTTLIGKMRKMGILRSTEAVLSPLPQSLMQQRQHYSRGKSYELRAQTVPMFGEDDVPPDLRPFIDVLLNGDVESIQTPHWPARKTRMSAAKKVKNDGNNGTRTSSLLSHRRASN